MRTQRTIRPTVVVGMAFNTERPSPPEPRAFAKSARTVVSDGAEVTMPDPALGPLLVEGELAIVIGAPAFRVPRGEARSVVAGFTVANDVTLTEQNALDPFWTQSKNGPGFTPLGDWMTDDIDPDACRITLRVDGEVVAEGDNSALRWGCDRLVEYITRYQALDVGDVILMGCPGVTATVSAGSTVSVEIDGVGTLTTPLVAGSGS